jgi:hypothetical protein
MKHIQSFDNYLSEGTDKMDEAVNSRAIEDAVEDGMEAFWSVVAKKFPQVKSGDFGPDETMALESAMKIAVSQWLSNNS